MSKPSIGVLHGGASYHLNTLRDQELVALGARSLYLPEVAADPDAALGDLDRVLVFDRLHTQLLGRCAAALLDVPARGGSLAVLGEARAHSWLPGVEVQERETNFWWWRTGEDPGIRLLVKEHPVWRYIGQSSVVWHFHGLLHPPADAVPLVVVQDSGSESPAGSILYQQSWPRDGRSGTLLVASMDPVFHHGSNFMPAATRLLHDLLGWLGAAAHR